MENTEIREIQNALLAKAEKAKEQLFLKIASECLGRQAMIEDMVNFSIHYYPDREEWLYGNIPLGTFETSFDYTDNNFTGSFIFVPYGKDEAHTLRICKKRSSG